ITVRIAPGIRAPVPRLRNPTRSRVRPGMTTNSGQLPPASNPVNWTRSANRPRTTSTTPSAMVEPPLPEGFAGGTYAGACGWYGAAGAAGASTTAAAAGGGSSVSTGVSTVSGAGSSADTSAVVASGSGVWAGSAGLFLLDAKTSGLPARTSGLTWTLGSPSEGLPDVDSFEVERLRLLIRPPAYTATLRINHARGRVGDGPGSGKPRGSGPGRRGFP